LNVILEVGVQGSTVPLLPEQIRSVFTETGINPVNLEGLITPGLFGFFRRILHVFWGGVASYATDCTPAERD
jgi:hypothetical protein